MKIKPIYLYAAVIILAVVLLLVFTQDANQDANMNSQNMPQDEIHKGLSPGNPSGTNVSPEIKHRLEMMEKAYQQNPDDTLRAREYAEFLAQAHHQDKAIEIYENILKKGPHRTDIRFSLALIHYQKLNFDKAESIISEVFKYDRNNAQAKYNIGAIEASRGNKEKARNIWNDLINQHPGTEEANMAQESLKALGT